MDNNQQGAEIELEIEVALLQKIESFAVKYGICVEEFIIRAVRQYIMQ